MTIDEPTDAKALVSTSDAGALMPVGAWIFLDLPDQTSIVCFTYVDPEAGFSAQGWKLEDGTFDQSRQIIIRLQISAIPWRPLEPDQVLAFGLDSSPAWVAEFYGPQPAPGTLWGLWRKHPKLDGRFLPDYADDLQVMVHDGGPRLTSGTPEVVWVRVTGMDAEVFRGRVLNQPDNLQSVRQGSEIKFLVADGAEFPLMVTEKYLAERRGWRIDPCRECGFSELFDAPSDLIRVVFPDMPSDGHMRAFTAFCALCGGVQLLRSRGKKF